MDEKLIHLWSEGFHAIAVAFAQHDFGSVIGITLMLACTALLLGFIAVVALFALLILLVGVAYILVGAVQFLDAVCVSVSHVTEDGTALAWRRRHWKRVRIWGELGRQFGAWDYEHVAELMRLERRRGVLSIPKSSQRKARKNERRRYARTNTGNSTGLGGS